MPPDNEYWFLPGARMLESRSEDVLRGRGVGCVNTARYTNLHATRHTRAPHGVRVIASHPVVLGHQEKAPTNEVLPLQITLPTWYRIVTDPNVA